MRAAPVPPSRFDEPVDADAARRRSDRRFGAVVLLLGLVLLALAGLAWSALPSAGDALRAYRAATPCAQQGVDQGGDCLSRLPATVERMYVGTGKNAEQHVVLTGLGAKPVDVPLGSLGSYLFDDAAVGDRVTATLWRGQVTAVSADGSTDHTDNVPVDQAQPELFGAVLGSVYGLTLAGVGLWQLLDRTSSRRVRSRYAGIPLLSVLCFSALLVPVFGFMAVVSTMSTQLIGITFAVLAGVAVVAALVVNPARPRRPRRPVAHLPSATSRWE